MSVKKILKELLEDNPDYSGRWDMDFKMDLQTKNHIRLVRLCQLLGFVALNGKIIKENVKLNNLSQAIIDFIQLLLRISDLGATNRTKNA